MSHRNSFNEFFIITKISSIHVIKKVSIKKKKQEKQYKGRKIQNIIKNNETQIYYHKFIFGRQIKSKSENCIYFFVRIFSKMFPSFSYI